MVSGMKTGYPCGLNKGLGSKFRDGSRLRQEGSRVRKEGSRVRKEGSRVRQEIPEAYWPKRCTDNNEDEDNSPNNADNTNEDNSLNNTNNTPKIIFLKLNNKESYY